MIATGERLEQRVPLLRRDGERRLGARRGRARARRRRRPALHPGLHPRHHRAEGSARRRCSRARRSSARRSTRSSRRSTDGMVTAGTRAAERIFGYSAEEMIGRAVELLLPEESDVLAYVDERLRRGERRRAARGRVHPQGRRGASRSSRRSRRSSAPRATIIGSSSITRDISERKRAQALAAGQAELLEFVAGGAALPRVLDAHRALRRGARRGRARIHPAARPRRRCTCATAPRRACRRPTARRSTASRSARASARAAPPPTAASACASRTSRPTRSGPTSASSRSRAGLRACWSTPIFATDGALLGTFALYYRERARAAARDDVELVELATHVAGIAIERARAEEAARDERGALPRPLRERQRADRAPSRWTRRSPR